MQQYYLFVEGINSVTGAERAVKVKPTDASHCSQRADEAGGPHRDVSTPRSPLSELAPWKLYVTGSRPPDDTLHVLRQLWARQGRRALTYRRRGAASRRCWPSSPPRRPREGCLRSSSGSRLCRRPEPSRKPSGNPTGLSTIHPHPCRCRDRGPLSCRAYHRPDGALAFAICTVGCSNLLVGLQVQKRHHVSWSLRIQAPPGRQQLRGGVLAACSLLAGPRPSLWDGRGWRPDPGRLAAI